MMKTNRWAVLAAALAITGGVLASPSQVNAQEEMDEVQGSAVAFSAGFDIVTDYYFRGLAQENEGFILQPYADLSVDIWSNEDFSVALVLGLWNSIHTGDSGSGDGGSAWFEADFYAGFSLGMPYNFTVDVFYLGLNNPNGGGIFAEELDLVVAYDDSELWAELMDLEGFALAPYVLVAFEVTGGSDAGGALNRVGVYIELGIEPSMVVFQSEEYPITVALPVSLGLNAGDYYQTGGGGPHDDKAFGFVDLGLVASTPLAFIPAEYGLWTASAGVHVLFQGDSASTISGGGAGNFGITETGEDVQVYGVFGVAMEF